MLRFLSKLNTLAGLEPAILSPIGFETNLVYTEESQYPGANPTTESAVTITTPRVA
jgi:hypothetical protein